MGRVGDGDDGQRIEVGVAVVCEDDDVDRDVLIRGCLIVHRDRGLAGALGAAGIARRIGA